jgi:hypothetical protein
MNVSRNGNYLLNISPRADGTIPDEQQEVLLAIGKWMDVNGEAIYYSRPWKISEGGRVHFTTKSDTLYAISLDWPDGELAIPALGEGKANEGRIEKVELPGAKGAPSRGWPGISSAYLVSRRPEKTLPVFPGTPSARPDSDCSTAPAPH